MRKLEMLMDTLKVFETGEYYKDNQLVKLKLTPEQHHESIVYSTEDICLLEEREWNIDFRNTGDMLLFCEKEDSYGVARKVKHKYPEEKVLVLNFANPVSPGGGVRRGSSAQEEDLCRKSSLLLALEYDSARDYYEHHRKMPKGLYSDYIIVSPEVEIIKDEKGELLEDTVVVSVITCAAPILYSVGDLDKDSYYEILTDRIEGILKVAMYCGYKYLVLGAWGCGAFGHKATIVSKIFKKSLSEMRLQGRTCAEVFKEVHFAVLDKSDRQEVFREFNKCFGEAGQ